MRLNKNTLYTLLFLLSGDVTAPEVSKRMPELDIRSVQRALERLTQLGLIERGGPKNSPSYAVQYLQLLMADIPAKILEDENRPDSSFSHGLIDWLREVPITQ